MQSAQQIGERAARPWWAGALGVLLTLHLLAALAMAASPELHQAVHPNAGSPEHHCFVTLLAGGSVEVSVTLAAVAAFVLICLGNFLPRAEVLLSAVPWRLLPGRAPPRFV